MEKYRYYVRSLVMALSVLAAVGLLSGFSTDVQSSVPLESAGMNGMFVAQAGSVYPSTADTSGVQAPGSVTPESPTPVPGEPSSPVPGVPQTPVPGEPSSPIPGNPVPGSNTTPAPGSTAPSPGTATTPGTAAPAPGTMTQPAPGSSSLPG